MFSKTVYASRGPINWSLTRFIDYDCLFSPWFGFETLLLMAATAVVSFWQFFFTFFFFVSLTLTSCRSIYERKIKLCIEKPLHTFVCCAKERRKKNGKIFKFFISRRWFSVFHLSSTVFFSPSWCECVWIQF